MKNVVACLFLGSAVVVSAQDFTSSSAKLARDNYQKTLSQADSTYKAALQSALRQAESRKDSDEEAERIRGALNTLAENQSLVAMAPSQVSRLAFRTAKVPAGNDPGYEIGKVRKGDKIVIKYDKGMFSRGDTPLSSPDVTDKVTCTLTAKSGKVYAPLATIPTGTKDHPFEYTFQADLESVALQTTSWRDAGEVSYKIAIIKAK